MIDPTFKPIILGYKADANKNSHTHPHMHRVRENQPIYLPIFINFLALLRESILVKSRKNSFTCLF